MSKGDRVKITRGNHAGHITKITRVIDPGYGGGARVMVVCCDHGMNLAASSVEAIER